MKRALIELMILAAISLPVSGLMLLGPHYNRRIERNWGELVYAPPVSFEEAADVAEVLVQQGVFQGQPISVKLTHDDETWRLAMVYRRDYERLVSRPLLVNAARQFCQAAFTGKTAGVCLADETFEPFDELVPPTPFPAPNR